MTHYNIVNHNVTDALKLKAEMITVGDLIPIFQINGDILIDSTLTQAQIDAVVIAAGD